MNLKILNYVSKKCPQCGSNASRYDNICIECQVPLRTFFDEINLIHDLDSFIQPIWTQRLKINRHKMLEDIFVEFPQLIPYAERIALINLTRNFTYVHLNQMNAEIQEYLLLYPQIKTKLVHLQAWIKEKFRELRKKEKVLSYGLPQNPFLRVFQEYAKVYPEYLEAVKDIDTLSTVKKRALTKGKPIDLTYRNPLSKLNEFETVLTNIINVAKRMGTALEKIRDLRQNVAHIRNQYHELVKRNPRSVVDLDESIDEYNAIIQSLGDLSMLVFHNGIPYQRNHSRKGIKRGTGNNRKRS
ncbi:MAG: hypothetical protein ACFFCS_27990 [Candidatus Hodarchaeota archaeon]